MFQAVLFDLDGTLLDTLADLANAGNHALEAMGLPVHPPERYKRMVGNGIPTLIERMLPEGNHGGATRALALNLFHRYYDVHKTDLTAPYPGIPQLLARLKRAGVRLGVVSNKDDALVREVIEQYFPDVFDAAAGRREGLAPKPDPTLVNEMRVCFSCTPEQTLYVGDSDVDVYTAHNAGLRCCGVLWGFRGREELAAAGADLLVSSPQEIEDAVLSSEILASGNSSAR